MMDTTEIMDTMMSEVGVPTELQKREYVAPHIEVVVYALERGYFMSRATGSDIEGWEEGGSAWD